MAITLALIIANSGSKSWPVVLQSYVALKECGFSELPFCLGEIGFACIQSQDHRFDLQDNLPKLGVD